MLGFSSEQSSLGYKTEQGFKAPFPNDAITGSFDGSKVAAGTNTVTEQTPNKLLSTFGRLQYNYDERYMLSGSLRFDGGSIFRFMRSDILYPKDNMTCCALVKSISLVTDLSPVLFVFTK